MRAACSLAASRRCLFCPLSLSFLAAARSLARLRWPACDHHVVMAAGDCYASLGMLLWVRQNEASQEAPRLISLFLPRSTNKYTQANNARNRDFHSSASPTKENCRLWTDVRGVTPASPANQAAIVMLGSLPRLALASSFWPWLCSHQRHRLLRVPPQVSFLTTHIEHERERALPLHRGGDEIGLLGRLLRLSTVRIRQ